MPPPAGSLDRVWPDRKRRDHWSPWQRAKYYLLVGFLVMAVLGGHWVCVFDPLVLLYRSTTTALLPGAQWAVEEGSTAIYQADPGVGPVRLDRGHRAGPRLLPPTTSIRRQELAFLGGWLILLVFVAMLLANAYRRRFWCRYLCPLGALLGSSPGGRCCGERDGRRLQPVRPVRQALPRRGRRGAGPPVEAVGVLRLPQLHAAVPPRAASASRSSSPGGKSRRVEGVDLSKRALLASAVGGAGRALPDAHQPPGQLDPAERAVRRPGVSSRPDPPAGSPERTRVSPALHRLRAVHEGLPDRRPATHAGRGRPGRALDAAAGAADGLLRLQLQPLRPGLPDRGHRAAYGREKQQVRIGLAAFDTTRCIPYAYGRETASSAKSTARSPTRRSTRSKSRSRTATGQKRTIKQPHVDPTLCIGCGICENVCPFKDRPAIRVTSANESRHPQTTSRSCRWMSGRRISEDSCPHP